MPLYIIDENLPSTLPLWNNDKFIHVLEISDKFTDTDIWQHAITNKLVIVTKDADFYNRYLSSSNSPKVIWIKTGNIKKKIFYKFIKQVWHEVEEMLKSSSFIIINEDKLEGF